MSLLLALALATAAPATRPCSWDRPGINPFMGDVVAAVDRYTDIAPATRAALKKRMAARAYDDVVSIKRDSVSGKYNYDPALRAMHFGNGTVCPSVSRARWSSQAEERGLVYCEKSECIIVPTICRNVSRITRKRGEAYPPVGFLPRRTPAAPVPAIPENAPPFDGGAFAPPDAFYPPVATTPPALPPLFPGDTPGCCRLLPPPPISGCADCVPHIVPPPLFPPPGPGVPPVIVPEPQTWSMMVAGLALVLAAAWRRRKS